MSNIPQFVACGLEKISNCPRQIPYDMAEHDRIIMNDLLDKVAERIKIRLIDNLGLENATKYGNKNAKQQANSYATVMKYEIADCVDDLLEDLAEMKAEVEE